MKKIYFFLFLVGISSSLFAQVSFENGYYINNSGETINCMIKNYGWKNNPSEIEYKLTEEGSSRIASLKNIQEFGISNSYRFIRAKVNMDYSPKKKFNVGFLSKKRDPEFKEETVFLKVLISGETTLYQYDTDLFTRFFFSMNDGEITPLIYKKYIAGEDKIKTNARFKQQLFQTLKCNKFSSEKFERLLYKSSSLIQLFEDYGKCKAITLTKVGIENKNGDLHLYIRPRVQSFAQFNINTGGIGFRIGSTVDVGLGFDLEYVLPFNKRKWSITFEPTFLNYDSGGTASLINSIGNTETYTIEAYKRWIKIPFGARHHFYLSEKSSLYVSFYYALDINFGAGVDIIRNSDNSIFQSYQDDYLSGNFNFGLGYKISNKLNIEARYNGKTKIVTYDNRNNSFQSGAIELALGYRLF